MHKYECINCGEVDRGDTTYLNSRVGCNLCGSDVNVTWEPDESKPKNDKCMSCGHRMVNNRCKGRCS